MIENGNILSGMQTLLVDDNPTNLDVLRKTLEGENYEVMVANNGEDAVEIATAFIPDLILLDVMMPGIDGLETCQRLKDTNGTQEIPIIFLTAKTEPEDIIKGFNSGGVDYISKPFHQEEVLARSKTHLKLKKTMEDKITLFKENAVIKDELIESERQYRAIVETSSDLIFKLDPDKNISFANSSFKNIGFDPSELVGKPISTFIDIASDDTILPQIATQGPGPLATNNLEIKVIPNRETPINEQVRASHYLLDSFGIWSVPDEDCFKKGVDKTFLGTLCIARENIEIKQLEEELRKTKNQLMELKK
jgi:CheY-like chemotaxis protein